MHDLYLRFFFFYQIKKANDRGIPQLGYLLAAKGDRDLTA
jgi:hypothetical protein